MDVYLVSAVLLAKPFIPYFIPTDTAHCPTPSYHVTALRTRYLTPIFPAINYRLSPQYPFPCAIQDALAAYLYLIRPPPGAKHKPVKPQHIVIMGDSAGGGLSLAALQVIRDSGLPQCAGGVLISPWCDLSHSFPSIHTNTETVNPGPSKPLAENALSLNQRTLYPIMACHCTNQVSCGLLLGEMTPIKSAKASDIVSGPSQGSMIRAGSSPSSAQGVARHSRTVDPTQASEWIWALPPQSRVSSMDKTRPSP